MPKGALPRGVEIRVSYRRAPRPGAAQRLGVAVNFRLVGPHSRRHLRKRLKLEYPASVGKATQIRTYDERRHRWRQVPTFFDPNRNLVSARLRHFSWYSPVVDPVRDGLAAAANHLTQYFGTKIGARAEPPTCKESPIRSNRRPSWVAGLDVAAGPNDPLPACGQSEGNVLAVEFVNNRPYGITINYGQPVTWGWSELGISLRSLRASHPVDGLYVPALSRGSVGIAPGAWSSATYSAGVNGLALMADIAGSVIGSVSFADEKLLRGTAARAMTYMSADCATTLLDADLPTNPRQVGKFIVDNAGCLEAALTFAVRSGALDRIRISSLANLRRAVRALKVVAFADVANTYVELIRDATVGSFGAFTVQAVPVLPPAPQPSPSPGPQPSPTPQPSTRVDAYSNYGSATAGHAMCRGNPARPESMPGGAVTQAFTVPAGVASLDTALVQIDPDSRVTATASLIVNGAVRATAAAAAGGDTRFNFPAVGVHGGDQAALSIQFSATFGKITTVYSAAAVSGTLAISNSCPDGAPSLTTGNGLRAVVTGWTS